MREALDDHREEERSQEQLLKEKARLEGEQSDIRSEIGDLEKRISELKNRSAGVVEDQKKQQLDADVRQLEKKLERCQSGSKGYESRLTTLDGKITDANEQVSKAGEKVSEARAVLRKKQMVVLGAASKVIKTAASQPLKEKIEGIGARIFNKLGVPGTLTVGYIFAIIVGLGGDLLYYGGNGVNIFHYAQPEDFFLSGYKLCIIPVTGFLVLWLLLTGIKLVLETLAENGFPVFTEKVALVFPGLIKWFATPVALALTIFFITPVAAYAFAITQQWQSSTSDEVSLVLEDPYEYAGQLAWIGSNSRYAFFRPVSSQSVQETGIMIIPFDRIACIRDGNTDNGNNCRNPGKRMQVEFKLNDEIKGLFDRLMDTLKSNNRIPPVTESEVHSYVENSMECGTGRPGMSDFILFENDKSALRAQAYHKIDIFLEESKNSSKTTVFGFASPDGNRGENMELAGERACMVANVVCAVVNQDYGIFEHQAKTTGSCGCPEVRIIADRGEEHFINGIANSRSAVIATCSEVAFDQA